jgi:hypothetical protein
MFRAKRILVLAAIVGSASLLHVSFCSWNFGGRGYPASAGIPILVWDRTVFPIPSGSPGEKYGVSARTGQSYPLAVVVGLVLPLNLGLLAAFLIAHWRERDRAVKGRCLACDHPLAGANRCPECGASAESAAASEAAPNRAA